MQNRVALLAAQAEAALVQNFMSHLPSDQAKTGSLWKSYPWLLYIAILIIAHFSAPFDFDRPRKQAEWLVYSDAAEAVENMERGNAGRQVSLLLLSAGAFISLMRKEKKNLRINGATGWFIISYMALCGYSISWSGDVVFVAKRVFKLYCLGVGALALAERLTLRQLLVLFVLIGVFPLLLSYYAEFYAGTFDPLDPIWRFGGGFHSIALGYHIGLALIACQPLACEATTKGEKVFWHILMLLLFFSILLTKSRMPFVGAMGGVALARYFYTSALDRSKFILWAVMGISLLVLTSGRDISMSDIMAMGRGEETKRMTGSFSGRTFLWAELLRAASEKPVIGWGYDSFLGPKNIGYIYDKLGWAPSNTHSDYINSIVGTGYLGFVFFVGIFLSVIKRSLRLIRDNRYYAVFAGVTMWVMLNSSMDAVLRNSQGVTLAIYIVFMKIAFTPPEKAVEEVKPLPETRRSNAFEERMARLRSARIRRGREAIR